MATKRNKICGVSFFMVIAAMIIFNSCGKNDATYYIDDSKCAQCLSCIAVCGQHAISLQTSGSSQKVVIDDSKCIGCGKCYKACSYQAISSK